MIGKSTLAQEGRFLTFNVLPSYTSIKNPYDFSWGWNYGLGEDFRFENSVSYGFSAQYTQINDGYVGWRTGVNFKRYEQSYSATVRPEPMGDTFSYASRVALNYVSVPIMVHFAISSSEDTRVFFSMDFGFQLGYLVNGSLDFESANDYNFNNSFAFETFYKRLVPSYVISSEVQIRVGKTDKNYINFGVDFDKNIGNVEVKDQPDDWPDDNPREWLYPFGALKNSNYTMQATRQLYNTKLEFVALKVGYTRKIFN